MNIASRHYTGEVKLGGLTIEIHRLILENDMLRGSVQTMHAAIIFMQVDHAAEILRIKAEMAPSLSRLVMPES